MFNQNELQTLLDLVNKELGYYEDNLYRAQLSYQGTEKPESMNEYIRRQEDMINKYKALRDKITGA